MDESKQDSAAVPVFNEANAREFAEIRTRLKAYDTTRETVIKRCRDVQKLSKNSIYSMHRGALEKAQKQLAEAKTLAEDIIPQLEEYPALRKGSYSNAMEEYAEAMLFLVWLQERVVAPPERLVLVNTEEYVGGLADFTGELGRFAVAAATRRDAETVIQCLNTDEALYSMLQAANLGPQLTK
eukprot:CAMPEP_0205831690 /NCGR_PEP_ID=MMETSP0206-20130828/44798_1 /ASSEMBLY_ACC=CAM_ASM_000279 /TAXON_ID=36767 /ORGANISM="Euplotes focardii, Strain TN1" /LENGTH=182 /DNA_ID=CAMNT_0053136555 /DNA_START=42 /DNA_END=587 /DNA_ORIENTATION=-